MNEIFRKGANLLLKVVIVSFMSLFIFISINVLCVAGFTKDIGYVAYGTTKEDSKPTELYTHYFADGDDLQKAEYEAKGYKINTNKIRSSLEGTGQTVFLISTQVICFLITWTFIYPGLWQLGAKDSNLVRFKHKAEDKWKGVKIGLVGTAPMILAFVALLICGLGAAKNLPTALYRFFNFPFAALLSAAFGSAQRAGELAFWQYLVCGGLLAVIPGIAGIAYLLGYKDISVSEKLIYKKTKQK